MAVPVKNSCLLVQCFSNTTPPNFRVPQNTVRGSEKNSGINTQLFGNTAKYKYTLKYHENFCPAIYIYIYIYVCVCRFRLLAPDYIASMVDEFS